MAIPATNITENNFNNLITSSQKTAPQVASQTVQEPVKEVQPAKKQSLQDDIFDKINNKVINSKDVTDTVTLPRAIFKGYFCFFAGTTLGGIAGMLPKSAKAAKATLGILGSVTAILGTFEFLKPLLLKQKQEDKKV